MTLYVIDISNAFQTNVIEDYTQRRYVSIPAFYLKWLKSKWPNHPALKHPAKDLVMQTTRKIQGEKDSGHDFFQLLLKILTSKQIGMIACTTNKGILHWTYNGYKSIIAITTDDLLFATQHVSCLDKLLNELTEYCSITIQKGQELSYLNL